MAHTKVTKTYSQNTGTANTYSYSGSFDVFKGTEVKTTLDGVVLTYTATTIIFDAVGEAATLMWSNSRWNMIGGSTGTA